MGERIFQHRPPAHRLRDEANVGKPQVIDQGGEVAGIVGGIDATRDRVGRREAAMGESHAGVAGREVRHLLPPAQVIAAQPVREDERRAAARDFVVEIAERALQPTDGAGRRGVGTHAKLLL